MTTYEDLRQWILLALALLTAALALEGSLGLAVFLGVVTLVVFFIDPNTA
mgnify:CR=1 FL=1